MQRILRRLRRNEKGFTLIELMVVIAIIGVLTALIIPRVLAAQNQAKINDTVNELRVVEAGIEQYYSSNTSLPAGVAQATTAGNAEWTKFVGEISQYASLPADVQDEVGTTLPSGATQDFNFVSWTVSSDTGTLIVTINDTNGGKDAVELVTTDPNASSSAGTYVINTSTNYGSSATWTQVASSAW